jgi:hypothetical protein
MLTLVIGLAAVVRPCRGGPRFAVTFWTGSEGRGAQLSQEHGAENVRSGRGRQLQQGKYLDRDELRAWRASESVTGSLIRR